jgi:peptidoglycan/LPS O-acetylase OafA/YrhL
MNLLFLLQRPVRWGRISYSGKKCNLAKPSRMTLLRVWSNFRYPNPLAEVTPLGNGFKKLKYRHDIDGLRAIAVLPVVFYHAGFPGPSGGFIGVDVFFVISGFLITSIVAGEIAEGRFSLVSFYERRARRILPALTAVILASFAVGWFFLLPAEMKNLGRSAFATGFFLSNVYFSLTLDYFSQAAEFAPLLHTWSLAVEEQFYLFFPPLLMLLAWMGWRRSLWIIAGLSLLSFVAAVVVLPLKPDWVFYLIFFRAWELGAGAMLALASLQPPKGRAAREGLALAGLAAILIPVFVFDSTTPFPAAAALPPVLGATILIWVGAKGGGSLVSSLLAHHALVGVGLISYSLYLWHWPILAFIRIVLDSVVLPMETAIVAVALSVAMAWMSFHFVERPFRVHPSRGFGRRAIFSVSALSLAIVVGVGGVLHITEGLPARLPMNVRAIAAFAENKNDRRYECFNQAPSQGLCSIGAVSNEDDTVDFLFWGDSHADAIMPGMDRAASIVGKNGVFAGRSACPPILGVQRVSGGEGCTTFNESVLSWLKGRPDVPLVILGARWTLSVEGTRYRGEAGKGVHLKWIGGSMTHPGASDNAALVEAGLNATVAEIVATGRSVLLLGPVPEIGQDVPASHARQALFGWTSTPILTQDDYDARAGRTERILKQLAEDVEGVRYLPLSALFCDAEQCQTTSADGMPLYVDDDHINQTAALNLLPPRLVVIWR